MFLYLSETFPVFPLHCMYVFVFIFNTISPCTTGLNTLFDPSSRTSTVELPIIYSFIICGDLNIHVDTNCSDQKVFLNLLDTPMQPFSAFGSKNNFHFPIRLFGNFIYPAVNVQNLGVRFDANISFADHVCNTCKSLFHLNA